MADIAGISEAPAAPRADVTAARAEAWDDGAGFYLVMSLVAAAIILVGFTPSFYLKSVIHAPPPLSPLTITHGVVFTGWLTLFVLQAGLIAAKKRAPHRQLGVVGAVLFGVMISLGVSTSITAGRLGHIPPAAPPALAFMALPLLALTATAGLFAAALLFRRRSDWHKRLMLASFFAMTGPGTHRIAVGAGAAQQAILLVFLVADLLLVAAVLRDVFERKRIHPAYYASAAVFAGLQAAVSWAFGSEAWMSFARVITQTA